MRDARRACIAALAVAALLLAPGAAHAKPLKRGSEGPRVAQVQRWLGISADGIFGPGTAPRGQALPAQPRPDRRRHRRPRHVERAQARPRAQGLERRRREAIRRRAAPARARDRRRRHLRAGHRGGREELPAQPRPDGRRHRRPRHLERARPPRPRHDPQATRRLPRRRPRRRRPRGPRRQPDPEQAVQVRRRPRPLERQRLRLLGLRLLRAARRRAALVGAHQRRLHALGRARQGPADHDLRLPQPRLHGHRRPPVRHDRAAARRGSRWQASHRSSAGYVVRHPPGL